MGHVPLENMHDARVVVVRNLKPSKMRGEVSQAMLLAAEKNEQVLLVIPPADAIVGAQLHFQGYDKVENPPRLKSKIWLELASKLQTNENGTVVFDNNQHPLVDESSNPESSTLHNATVR